MQKTIALSTAEAEYYSASEVAVEIIYLRNLIRNMGLPQEDDTPVHENKIISSVVAIVQSISISASTSHMKSFRTAT